MASCLFRSELKRYLGDFGADYGQQRYWPAGSPAEEAIEASAFSHRVSSEADLLAQANAIRDAHPELSINSKQFGKKVGKHAADFGLDASSAADRQAVRSRIEEIYSNPAEVRQGP